VPAARQHVRAPRVVVDDRPQADLAQLRGGVGGTELGAGEGLLVDLHGLVDVGVLGVGRLLDEPGGDLLGLLHGDDSDTVRGGGDLAVVRGRGCVARRGRGVPAGAGGVAGGARGVAGGARGVAVGRRGAVTGGGGGRGLVAIVSAAAGGQDEGRGEC